MSKIKLGYFTPSSISFSETFIYDLISAFNDDKDIDVSVIGGKINHLIVGIDNIKIISTGYNERGYYFSFLLYKLGQIIGNRGHRYKNIFRMYCAYKALNDLILNKPDIAYIEYGTSAVLCRKYLVEKNIPFLVHVHGYDVTSALKDTFYLNELKEVFKCAEYIITPSIHLKRIVIELGCSPDKIFPIYPLTNFDGIQGIDFEKRRIQSPTVSFLGRLTPKKNPIALIYAFNLVVHQIPNAKLNILGDGELMSEVIDLIEHLGLSNNIKLFGNVNRKTAFNVLSESQIYAQHSVTSLDGDQEGFPVSLAEAAAHALPLVSTIHSGITENIIDGKTGFLVQEHDFEAMAKKIIYLIRNPHIAEQMGKAGREHILQICAPGMRVEKLKKLLLDALNHRNCRN